MAPPFRLRRIPQDPGPWVQVYRIAKRRQCPYVSRTTGERCYYRTGHRWEHNQWAEIYNSKGRIVDRQKRKRYERRAILIGAIILVASALFLLPVLL